MQCPKCESDDVLLCSVAYDQGKSVAKREGQIDGGMDGGGRITLSQESTETVLTEFAKRAAAPTPKTHQAIYTLIAAIVAFFVVPSAWHDLAGRNPSWLYFVLLAAIAFAIYRVVSAYKNKSEDGAQKAAWERSWICKRCGNIFDPSEKAPGVTPAE